jgi:hypothetical protein
VDEFHHFSKQEADWLTSRLEKPGGVLKSSS